MFGGLRVVPTTAVFLRSRNVSGRLEKVGLERPAAAHVRRPAVKASSQRVSVPDADFNALNACGRNHGSMRNQSRGRGALEHNKPRSHRDAQTSSGCSSR